MKLLIISGPTATGKTALAIKLAKKFNGELISADSRQVYRGMDIGTGKDHPRGTKIHLIDIINPDQSFSVAQYQQLALEKITETIKRGKLPIVVGGTGQYIDSIINSKPTFSVPPNKALRFFLNYFPIKLLQFTLRLLDFATFRLLNNSDVNNPHRLIRKIEIRLSKKLQITNYRLPVTDYLHISLTAPNDYLYSRVDQRVESRLKLGLVNEIKSLLKKYKWSDPGLNCLAYKEFAGTDLISIPQKLVDTWRFHEHSYVRRQKTWFKKIPGVLFFDITTAEIESKIIKEVGKWYNNS